jgi:hypothetical protein
MSECAFVSIMEKVPCCKMKGATAIRPSLLPLDQRPTVLVDVYPVA